jgi:uncharacterized cupredoxin-like copper-binding protein
MCTTDLKTFRILRQVGGWDERAALPGSQSAGKVTFVVRNVGTVEHEMVVIRRDAGALPVHAYRASETGAFDEVEELERGKSGRLTVALKPGRYLLVCNIAGHYQLGMSTVLKVAQND